MVIKQGTPAVTAAGSVALGQAVAEITPGVISMTSVLGNMLANFEDPAYIVIDPQTGKAYASSINARKADLLNAVDNDCLKEVLEPVAGQTGRSLAFNQTLNQTSLDCADLVTAVKPKFSVESIVNRLLAKIQEAEAVTPADAGKFFIVVDQTAKKVSVLKADGTPAADLRTALDAVALNAGESAKITLTPAAEDVVADALPFEGGVV